jgi:hypothetical protein
VRWVRGGRATLWVWGLALAWLMLQRHLGDSTWTPRGPDWDTWYQGVLSLGQGLPYPPNRWPMYSFVAALGAALLPGAAFINAQWVSVGITAATVAGVFHLGRVLLGTPGGLVAAVLTCTFPMLVESATWISCYPLWTAASVWTVTALVEAHRTGDRRWWVATGLALGVATASQDKGLAMGLGMGAMVLGSLVFDWRRVPRNLGLFLAPIGVLALGYAAFPHDLMTLDAQIRTVEEAGLPSEPGGVIHDASYRADYTSDGYIFGRAMGPGTIRTTLQRASALSDPGARPERLKNSQDVLVRAFPGVDLRTLQWLGLGQALGLLVGLVALFRRKPWLLLGWVGVAALIIGVSPSVLSSLSLRFLMPGFAAAPLLLVAPVALLLEGVARLSTRGRWLPWLGLVVVPAVLGGVWPGSPWVRGDATLDWLSAQLQPGTHAMPIWYELRRDHPDVTIHLEAPGQSGLLALDGRSGTLLTPDPRFHPKPQVWPVAQPDFILKWWEGPALPPGELIRGRPWITSWPTQKTGAILALLGASVSDADFKSEEFRPEDDPGNLGAPGGGLAVPMPERPPGQPTNPPR